MGIEFLKHDDIDYECWQECTESSPNNSVYSSTWFLDSVSPGWSALVYGDYEAVMPVHFSDGVMCTPEYTDWIGIYGANGLTDRRIVNAFLDFISVNFKYVDICLDKFSYSRKPVKGRILYHSFYQFDTVTGVRERVGSTSPTVKKMMMKLGREGFSFQDVPLSAHIGAQMRSRGTLSSKSTETLARLTENASKNKSWIAFYMKDKDGKTAGTITVVYDSNYVYIPFMTVERGYNTEVGQMIMIYQILTFFENSSAVLVTDPERLGINEKLLAGMGAERHFYRCYRIDRISKIRDFFKF
jgi:hypothetical protein